MKNKPKIFLASSSEGLDVAHTIENKLSDRYDFFLWTDVFPHNESTYETLIALAKVCDYAIFIGTADELSTPTNSDRKEREGERIKHRDNVIFELGLFTGMLGKERCLYLVDKTTVKYLASDFHGITLFDFDHSNISKHNEPLISKIEKAIISITNRHIPIYPTKSLAVAYFSNFIQAIVQHYNSNDCICFDEIDENLGMSEGLAANPIFDVFIKIIVPENIPTDLNSSFKSIQNKLKKKSIVLKEKKLESIGRSRKIHVDVCRETHALTIYDVPSILGSLRLQIKDMLTSERNSKHFSHILEREIESFCGFIQELYDDMYAGHCISFKVIKESDIV